MLRTVLQIFFIILLFTGPLSVKGQIIVDENTPHTSQVGNVGASATIYYFTQSFIADIFVITKFGMWLQMGASNGGVKISVCPAKGNGDPDLSQILYESSLILPSVVGGWYYEDNLTIDIDSGKKYFLLVDGYNNAGASGYARVGYSTIYTSTGEAMKYTQNNTTWTIWTRPLCIYVEGSLCKLASITGLDPWYCASNTSITLTTSPAGGTLSGPGISGLIFNSSLAGVGTHHIIYSYTDGNCSEVDTQQVIVYASPAADFTYTVNGAVVDFTDNSSLAANWVWDFSDGYISTLKNVTHFFLYGGIYDVELIVKEDSLICEDNVTKQIDMTHLGASEIDPTGPKLSVFPNPGSALLHLVYTPVGSSDAEILVYDALGVLQINLIMEPTHSATLIHELDISFLASGVYFLQLQIGDETRRVKFVKD